jgi:hypothetical protein
MNDLWTDALRNLRRALNKLDAGHGRIGRGNSRHGVKDAITRIQARVDASFPVIRKPVKERRGPLSDVDRQRDILLRGWRPAVGVQVNVIAATRAPYERIAGLTYAPVWVIEGAKEGVSALRKLLRTNWQKRRAFLAKQVMKNGKDDEQGGQTW